MVSIRHPILILLLAFGFFAYAGSHSPRFYPDDPIWVVPAPSPVAQPLKRNVNLISDVLVQSQDPEHRPATAAGAVNTLGEVPDSEWFTNRHGTRGMSQRELQAGPSTENPPAPPFTVMGGKTDGIMPGFVMQDANGRTYFVKVDSKKYPELASAADVIVSKFFYAIGYNTPSNEILYLKLQDLHISDKATVERADGRERKMRRRDVEKVFADSSSLQDGSFRVMASLAIEGEGIGPFRYQGTRDDDPNDVVPHENRRDLRALHVFAAWLNHTDAKAGNTLDTVVQENGVRFIRHYLIDFGSALGSDGDRPKDSRFGNEFMLPTPTEALKGIFTLGLDPQPWERIPYPDFPGVGRLEFHEFDPSIWKTNYPNPAFLSRLPDDDFWAAKIVMAFTDDDIRAIVETGRLANAQSAEYLIAALCERRDRIGRTFFSPVLPLDRFRIENGALVFEDLVTRYDFGPARTYQVQWSRFDNLAGTHQPIAGSETVDLPPEVRKSPSGSYFSALLSVPGEESKGVTIYVRNEGTSFKVVGIDRHWLSFSD